MTESAITHKALNTIPENWRDSLQSVCDKVAPVWPLDQWIAVNPFWGLRHLPAPWADRLLNQRGGHSILPPKDFYKHAWDGGRIRQQDLTASLEESSSAESLEKLVAWLERPAQPRSSAMRSAMDSYPATPDGDAVLDAVGDQIARTCAAFFDQRQARWSAASPDNSFFSFWLESSSSDLALDSLTGIRGARRCLKAWASDADEAAEKAIAKLGIIGESLEDLAHGWLLRINGWASWCRGEDWRADLESRSSARLWELLTVVLVWEAVALECATTEQRVAWLKQRSAGNNVPQPDLQAWIWQRAFEIGFQDQFLQALSASERHKDASETPEITAAAVQAVFCIDVRSEVMRRHLEQANPAIQTLGFAGFFGLPFEHQGLGPVEGVRQLPGLLKAPYRLVDSQGNMKANHQAHRNLDQKEISRSSIRSAKYSSLSTFTLVETTGLAWAWKLIKDSLKKAPSEYDSSVVEQRLVHKVGGDPVTDQEKAKLVAGMLQGMSLTRNFAPLVAFVGHGSRANNNPHKAGLACGACGGQSGATNARLAASLFNDPSVRAKLSELGIRIPDYSWAIAAEHCTLTDQVRILDEDRIPETHLLRLTEFREGLGRAGFGSRRERATALGLDGQSDEVLLQLMEERGDDWAEVRPEWGLASNAAIVFAQRNRTRGVDLGGRVFLHDYDGSLDETGEVLEALMTAPMVVANWINMQYFASVSSPDIYGAGNKLLHSVVGGNVGVIEGNSPQLRIGLPLQSVHDGTQWRHEPVRLTVLIDAPAERIESVIGKHRVVADLVENQWILLHRYTETGFEKYRDGDWVNAEN